MFFDAEQTDNTLREIENDLYRMQRVSDANIAVRMLIVGIIGFILGRKSATALARTVAGKRPEPPGPYRGQGACTFCTDRTTSGVRHDLCPGEIHTSPGTKDDKVWTCACWREGHRHEHRCGYQES